MGKLNEHDRSRTRRSRRYFVGLAALLVAASTLVIAGPVGALTNDCDNTMNPAKNGNSSGLYIACTFSGLAAAGTSLTVDDYKNAVWHAGAVRQVTVTVSRANSSEAGHYVVKFAGSASLELGPQASDVNHSIENLTSTPYTLNGHNGEGTGEGSCPHARPGCLNTPTGAFIDAGTTIRSVVTGGAGVGYWVLSKPTIDNRVEGTPGCTPAGGGTCNTSVGITLVISNNVGRQGNNGVTTANSAVVTSAQSNPTGCTGVDPADCSGAGTANQGRYNSEAGVASPQHGMHFCNGTTFGGTAPECASTSDLGNFIKGGDLPDGAQIDTAASTTSVTLKCDKIGSVGGAPPWNWGDADNCVSPFIGTVTASTGVILTITPYPIPTSTRFISGATFSGSQGGAPERTITMGSATFSKFDVGMLVRGCDTSFALGSVCAVGTATAIASGARIASVSAGGTTAVLDPVSGTSSTWTTGAGQHFTLGIQSKTAPSTGDIVGALALETIFDPALIPDVPKCSANKVSAFQFPIKWRNPGPSPINVFYGAGYDFGFTGPPVNHYAGASMSGVSTAQLTILTSVTTFAGFLRQNITVAATVPTTTRWVIHFESLPFGIGICSGTGIAETLEIKGLSSKDAMNPWGTGGAFNAVRALLPEAQNNAGGTTYTGSAVSNTVGAHVTAGAPLDSEENACTIPSPNIIGIGCPEAKHTL